MARTPDLRHRTRALPLRSHLLDRPHALSPRTRRIRRRREAALSLPALNLATKSLATRHYSGRSRRRTFVCTSAISAQPLTRTTVPVFHSSPPLTLGSPLPRTLLITELRRLTTWMPGGTTILTAAQ